MRRPTPATELSVDLEAERVWDESEDVAADFNIAPFQRYSLLNGLDSIGLTLEHEDNISEFERRRSSNGGVLTF